MWREKSRQKSFADALVNQRSGQNQGLKKIDELVDWSTVEERLRSIHDRREGRPAYLPLVMFKSLLLQQLYQLSDVELEEALADRLSFRRFVGLNLDQTVPDSSTLWRFRQSLAGLEQQLFRSVTGQLEAKGFALKRGTLIDATLVEASVRAPRGQHSQPGQSNPLDPDAEWTDRKFLGGKKSYFGYKAHLAVDQGSGLIRRQLLSGNKTAESAKACELVCGDEARLYADKAYHTRELLRHLAERGIGDGVMRKNFKHSALVARRNRRLSPIRAAVERTFALMKGRYRYRRVRYRGLARNAVQLALICVAINLRRALVISAA